jgi:putative nucleotidyltransferase with HDIG domain
VDETINEAEMTMNFSNNQEDDCIGKKRQAVLQFTNNTKPSTFSLDVPQVVIGRAKDVDIHINDNYLSVRHARILVVHNFYYIEDLSSRNGTKVNGEPITFIRLAHQDVIRVGQTNLSFIQTDSIDENYINKLNLQTIQSLALAVEAKDRYTKGHSERVGEISEHLATMLGLSAADIEHVRIAGILHDIGKIGISETLLLKKTKLDKMEFESIKQHPVEGQNILRPLNFLNDILPAVYHHHERYDGKGYPDGLAGEDIPYLARIVQVADTYDAMTSDRPYRAAFSKSQAMTEISRCAGTQLDPKVTHTMLKILQNEL